MEEKRLVVVLSGPSGCGKNRKISKMISLDNSIATPVSATTRVPREGEVHGVHYLFKTDDGFEEMVHRNEFLEYFGVHGKRYGTPRRSVEDVLERDFDALLDVDVQGARMIKSLMPEAITIFLYPESMKQLERHLRERGKDSEESIAERLRNAPGEMAQCVYFDHVIVNDDYERADQALCDIIYAYRRRPSHPDSRWRSFSPVAL